MEGVEYMINQQRIIDKFIALVEIGSVSGREGNIRDYLVAEFGNRGLSLQEDQAGELLNGESGNLWVKIPGNIEAEPVLFSAHMDTVEPGEGIQAVIRDGVIKSNGSTILGSDDKAAIAAIMEAVDVLQENNLPHGPVELLFTVSEEQGLQGAKSFDFTQLNAAMAYVLDAGGDPGTIIIQSPCQNEIEYKVYGKPAHAGINPEKGINAIYAAAMALAKMPCGRIDQETTCNIGIIEGGKARNIVADYCQIKGEARSLIRAKLDDITELLKNTFINEVQKQGARAQVDIKFLYPEIRLSPQDRVVKIALKAMESIGLRPRMQSTGGGSDASIIHGRGIPCANLGIGMSNVHTCEEYIEVAHLIKDAEIVLAIIKEISSEA